MAESNIVAWSSVRNYKTQQLRHILGSYEMYTRTTLKKLQGGVRLHFAPS